MVFNCNQCGAPLTVDDARIPKTSFRLKCNKCQNLMKIEPPKSPAPEEKRTAQAQPPPPAQINESPAVISSSLSMPTRAAPQAEKFDVHQPGASSDATADLAAPVAVAPAVTTSNPARENTSAPAADNRVGGPNGGNGTASTIPSPLPELTERDAFPTAGPSNAGGQDARAAVAPPGNGGASLAAVAEAVELERAQAVREVLPEPPRDAPPAAEAEPPKPLAPDQPHYLKKIQLFRQLSFEDCLMVESRLKVREYAPQQAIVKEGGPGDSMYFIGVGAVEIRKRDPHTGIDFLLTELKAGACFGEMALLTGKPRAASVFAIEPTTCRVLESADFDALLQGHAKIALALSRVLAERLEEANQQSGIEFINLHKLQFDERVLSLLPAQVIQQHKVLPVAFSNNRLTLAMVNPNNLIALDDVRRLIKGVMIEPVVTSEDDFKRFLATTFGELLKKEEEKKARELSGAAGPSPAGSKPVSETAKASTAADAMDRVLESLQSEALKSLEVDDSQQTTESITDLSRSAEDAPIIRLANNVLALAIKRGASDIHIEPQEKEVAVRFRIDGELQQVQVLPKKIQMGLISRLKILSKLDIAEKRLPQDGRISVRLEDRPIDFRVSTIPSKWGEKICMRILDKSNTLLGLDKLILLPDALEQVRDMIAQPYGIIYVTGPTGSGKTTSLYSALAELNDPNVNISTAEDPIEYDLSRVNQVQAHKEIGLDFARILRAFLRQDPDIILVGETRDKETAHIAVEAALTGHLVFTTLHTNDAAGAFVRLSEMGVEPFLMSSSTIGVMAQRLTRRLCQSCKEPYTPDEISMRYMGLEYDPKVTFYRNRGCEKCSGTGFKGRVGVYEVLRMNGELRKLVASAARSEDVTAAAVRNGMNTLKDYSVWLLKNGWTTMEEVLQVVAVHE